MIELYSPDKKNLWNGFLPNSKRSSFLFQREFMDYHQDRFQDHSLIYSDQGKVKGILPANIDESKKVWSHQGLSYGSLVVREDGKFADTCSFFYEALKFLNDSGVEKMIFKAIPQYYDVVPGMEIEYCLKKCNATLIRTDLTSIIYSNRRLPLQNRRKRAIKDSKKNGLVIKEELEFEKFWNDCLIPNLMARHGTMPVHSVEEIVQLSNSFPKNIFQFNVYKNDKVVGGATIFMSGNVAHVQYIAANDLGKDLRALDFLFDQLISERFANSSVFDFGISTYDNGSKLNSGLLEWKEGFGARSHALYFFEIDCISYVLLEDLL